MASWLLTVNLSNLITTSLLQMQAMAYCCGLFFIKYILNMFFKLLFRTGIKILHHFQHFRMQRFKPLAHSKDDIYSSLVDAQLFNELYYQIELLYVVVRIEPLAVYPVGTYKSLPLIHAKRLRMDFEHSRYHAYHVQRAAPFLPVPNPHGAPSPFWGVSCIKSL